jgi:hypothetical protein
VALACSVIQYIVCLYISALSFQSSAKLALYIFLSAMNRRERIDEVHILRKGLVHVCFI